MMNMSIVQTLLCHIPSFDGNIDFLSNNAGLLNGVFRSRYLPGAAVNVFINRCIFLDCVTKNKGSAVFMSIMGDLTILSSTFYGCSTSDVGGIMYSTVQNFKIERTCLEKSNSTANFAADSQGNSFHAFCVRKQHETGFSSMHLCTLSMCPEKPVSADETMGFRRGFHNDFCENNASHNIMAAREVVTFWDANNPFGAFRYNLFADCVSGIIVSSQHPFVVENCAFLQNKPTAVSSYVLQIINSVEIFGSVFMGNAHEKLCSSANLNVAETCFCANSFTQQEDKCVQGLFLARICPKSLLFTKQIILYPWQVFLSVIVLIP